MSSLYGTEDFGAIKFGGGKIKPGTIKPQTLRRRCQQVTGHQRPLQKPRLVGPEDLLSPLPFPGIFRVLPWPLTVMVEKGLWYHENTSF